MREYVKKNDLPASLNKLRTMIIFASRGCVGKCTFCIHDIGPYRGLHIYEPKYFYNEIKLLYQKYSIRNFLIGEELMSPNLNYLGDFVKFMNDDFPDAYYSFPSIAAFVNPDVVKILEKGNCTSIAFGIESGSEKILTMMKKPSNAKQNLNALLAVEKSKINFGLCLMVGHPGENLNTLNETLDLLRKSKINKERNVFYTTPYPGSLLFHWAIRKKIIVNVDDYLMKISDHPASKFTVNLTQYPDFVVHMVRFYLQYNNFHAYTLKDFLAKNPAKIIWRIYNATLIFFKKTVSKFTLILYFRCYREILPLISKTYQPEIEYQDLHCTKPDIDDD